jgi:hypothetical protein
VALDQKYINQDEFQSAFDLAYKTLRKIVRFAAYLEANSQARQVNDEQAEYHVD